MDFAYYYLSHLRAEINTREAHTTFDNIKPASTPATGSESKVVEGNKQTDSTAFGAAVGTSAFKPTALLSFVKTKAKEFSSTKEHKVFDSGIIQKDHNGAIWWEFRVDDSNQQQHGLDLQELGTLPCVSCTFEGSSGDTQPSPVPDLFGVEVMSCWSLISSESNLLSLLASWPTPGSSEVKQPTPYSNLCQIMLMDLPSQLLEGSFYKDVAEVPPSG